MYSFCESGHFTVGAVVQLSKAESQHAVRVRRLSRGDGIILLDGRGARAHATIEQPDARATQVRIDAIDTYARPQCLIHLAQVIPKGKTMDTIIRQATEIGVASIQPLISEHSDVRVTGERAISKQNGWRKTAIEACKQCGCPYLPEIHLPIPWRQFVTQAQHLKQETTWKFIASLEEKARSIHLQFPDLVSNPREAYCLIGPEGDFSVQEYMDAQQLGFLPVRLASNVLRCDTAATYTLSILDNNLNSKN